MNVAAEPNVSIRCVADAVDTVPARCGDPKGIIRAGSEFNRRSIERELKARVVAVGLEAHDVATARPREPDCVVRAGRNSRRQAPPEKRFTDGAIRYDAPDVAALKFREPNGAVRAAGHQVWPRS